MTGFAIRCIDLTQSDEQCNAKFKACDDWLNANGVISDWRKPEEWIWAGNYGTVIIQNSETATMFKLAFGL